MPLYTDSGYSYYGSSGGGLYSSYYSTPLYGSTSSSSSPYAPYSAAYNRTYVLPTTSRSTQYASLSPRYQPKLSTITESPLTSRANFIPLTRIQSPKFSTYTSSLPMKYISVRSTRPKMISTADIDVSPKSRYGQHHHMDNRQKDEEKAEAVEEAQSSHNTDSDTSSATVDPNSPFMPRVDGTDVGHHARSTIRRNRAVVRLSIMRPRSRNSPKNAQNPPADSEPTADSKPDEQDDEKVPLEKLPIYDNAKEEGIKICVTDVPQSQTSEVTLNEVLIEVDPVTHTVRRLSIPQVPSFHDICEDISSDKIDDDLNAGVLRRRASLIQEQEIEIINELQKSQSGSFQVIHLERNSTQEDCRKSRKSKKVKKVRHKITANVDVQNSPLTPIIQNCIEEETSAKMSPKSAPKFTFNIEDIEEHKVFKLPKKRAKSVKSKKVEESPKELEAVAPDHSNQEEETETKMKTPRVWNRIEKSDSGEDFWSQIGTRESIYMDKRKKDLDNAPIIEESQTPQSSPVMAEQTDQVLASPATSPSTPSKTEAPSVLKIEAAKQKAVDSLKKDTITKKTDEVTPKSPLSPSVIATPTPMSPKSPTTPLSKNKESSVPKKPVKELDFTKKEVQSVILKTPVPESTKIDPKPTTPLSPTAPEIKTSPKKTITKSKNLESSKKTPSLDAQKDDSAPPTPKKLTSKSPDSPKPLLKPAPKKKSSPKSDVKEEASTDTNSQSKTKPIAVATPTTHTTSTTDENISASPKINSRAAAKSPEKKKTVKTDATDAKQSIIKNETDQHKCKEIPVTARKAPASRMNEQEATSKAVLQQPLTPTNPIARTGTNTSTSSDSATAVNENKQDESGKAAPYDTDIKQSDSSQITSTVPTTSSPDTLSAKQETRIVTSSLSVPPNLSITTTEPETDVSAPQVSTVATTATTVTKNSPKALATSSPTTNTTSTKESDGVLARGGNNLSKFATVSNLAQYLLNVDVEVEDYIPSSAEETDSSSDSYSGDGSLSASMKKKNKQLRKKAKEEQGFDPNKKVKIDPKKKCYVKEEAPRYPLVATPRPLWRREKVVYEESSNSSSEESESESECTTSDEYEDELCPKDASIRMSTCSNDSGFDGGTAPSSSKKALGAHEARDSPCSPLSLNPAYKIEANDDETSYTYQQFQKSGRITAPATTIPRFKKYAVEDFHFLAVLGKGSFGKVLLAELRNTDFYYAVKCLKKDVVLEDDDVECTLIERKVLALGTKHPYLCHLFCTFQTESHLFFVMEYLNGGDLMFHIQESGRFPEDRARFYGAEIISGLKFLHKKGIIYRDLKLDNVLLDFDGHVRIADFGMCKLQIYLDKTADSFCGTPDYMAPEIIKGDKYNQNVDWWSFGVLLYEMLIGQSPFSGCDEDELFWSICNEIPWFPVYISQEATSILKGLLEKDYTKRVGSQYSPAGDICDHIFFSSIDWGLLEKRQIPPPFKPQVKHPLDTQYFDRAFTRERVRLTPIDKEILQSMDQEQFQGFSYTNPNATLD